MLHSGGACREAASARSLQARADDTSAPALLWRRGPIRRCGPWLWATVKPIPRAGCLPTASYRACCLTHLRVERAGEQELPLRADGDRAHGLRAGMRRCCAPRGALRPTALVWSARPPTQHRVSAQETKGDREPRIAPLVGKQRPTRVDTCRVRHAPPCGAPSPRTIRPGQAYFCVPLERPGDGHGAGRWLCTHRTAPACARAGGVQNEGVHRAGRQTDRRAHGPVEDDRRRCSTARGVGRAGGVGEGPGEGRSCRPTLEQRTRPTAREWSRRTCATTRSRPPSTDPTLSTHTGYSEYSHAPGYAHRVL